MANSPSSPQPTCARDSLLCEYKLSEEDIEKFKAKFGNNSMESFEAVVNFMDQIESSGDSVLLQMNEPFARNKLLDVVEWNQHCRSFEAKMDDKRRSFEAKMDDKRRAFDTEMNDKRQAFDTEMEEMHQTHKEVMDIVEEKLKLRRQERFVGSPPGDSRPDEVEKQVFMIPKLASIINAIFNISKRVPFFFMNIFLYLKATIMIPVANDNGIHKDNHIYNDNDNGIRNDNSIHKDKDIDNNIHNDNHIHKDINIHNDKDNGIDKEKDNDNDKDDDIHNDNNIHNDKDNSMDREKDIDNDNHIHNDNHNDNDDEGDHGVHNESDIKDWQEQQDEVQSLTTEENLDHDPQMNPANVLVGLGGLSAHDVASIRNQVEENYMSSLHGLSDNEVAFVKDIMEKEVHTAMLELISKRWEEWQQRQDEYTQIQNHLTLSVIRPIRAAEMEEFRRNHAAEREELRRNHAAEMEELQEIRRNNAAEMMRGLQELFQEFAQELHGPENNAAVQELDHAGFPQ
ncbi:unknown protein [Seminavis robusta]|uniref:Uncharacterized protein n=1 Tax=Seminavis robusta TaxID=568900 RepID=A0A9N8EXI2_9STRA|nr:unknown protein [Seminavis robusta]|eukprot:Sro2693_g334810.1 n/a (512) ;mRNA; f:1857-3392